MKKINERGFHLWLIPLIIVLVGITGFAGWYVYDANKGDNEPVSNITAPTPTPTATPTVAPTPAVANTQNELDTLRTFCQGGNPDMMISEVVYIENDNGKYGRCSFSDAESNAGASSIRVYVDNEWKKVFAGNGGSEDLCEQYKIPSEIHPSCNY